MEAAATCSCPYATATVVNKAMDRVDTGTGTAYTRIDIDVIAELLSSFSST
jgi:hypothetical protein